MLLLIDSHWFLLKPQIRYLPCQLYMAWPSISPSNNGLRTSYPRVWCKYCLFHWVLKAKASSSVQFPLPSSAQHSMPLPFYSIVTQLLSAIVLLHSAHFSNLSNWVSQGQDHKSLGLIWHTYGMFPWILILVWPYHTIREAVEIKSLKVILMKACLVKEGMKQTEVECMERQTGSWAQSLEEPRVVNSDHGLKSLCLWTMLLTLPAWVSKVPG